MAPRSIGSATISWELVTIPVKLFTAQSKTEFAFNRLERATGARTKQQIVSSVDGRVLESSDLVSGLEYTHDHWVVFEPEELKKLDALADQGTIRVHAFVPVQTIDPAYIVKTVLVAPDKGGERAYHLLASQLAHRGEAAVVQRGGRTRDDVLLLMPHASGEGLILQEVLYPNEVRVGALKEIVPIGQAPTSKELELSTRMLNARKCPTFEEAMSLRVDNSGARLRAEVERKVAGHEIVVPPTRDAGGGLSLLEQLEASAPPPELKQARPPVSKSPRSQPKKQVRTG